MNWNFLSVESVIDLHRLQIEEFGGSSGLRDAGLLESAVLRAINKANFEPDASLATLAASLSFGLIKNHAFIDGNKRIGLSALVNFLDINGHRVSAPKEEVLAMVLKAAASEINEGEWTDWVELSTEPIQRWIGSNL